MRPPKLIKPYVLTFARQVAPQAVDPLDYVPCAPLQGAPYNACFLIIEAYVATHGGTRVLGWAIWERPNVFLEAEFHAVWRAPDGTLLDLSPRPFPIPRILFLTDPQRLYRGEEVDNIRKALTRDKNVHRFLALRAQRFKLRNKRQSQRSDGAVTAAAQLITLDKDAAALEQKLIQRYGQWLPERG